MLNIESKKPYSIFNFIYNKKAPESTGAFFDSYVSLIYFNNTTFCVLISFAA